MAGYDIGLRKTDISLVLSDEGKQHFKLKNAVMVITHLILFALKYFQQRFFFLIEKLYLCLLLYLRF